MTVKQRLRIYQKASKEYQTFLKRNPDYRKNLSWFYEQPISMGMCNVLRKIKETNIGVNIRADYPELYTQKTKSCYSGHRGYWWVRSNIERRIVALECASAICQTKIKQGIK